MSPSGPTSWQNQCHPIAVVGMAGIFPGATTIEGLSDVLYNGQTTVSEVRYSYNSIYCTISLELSQGPTRALQSTGTWERRRWEPDWRRS